MNKPVAEREGSAVSSAAAAEDELRTKGGSAASETAREAEGDKDVRATEYEGEDGEKL